MNLEKKHIEEVEKKKKRKHERQFSVHDKEIFLAKVFRCSFKIMDRSQRRSLIQMTIKKIKKRK